MPFVAGWQFYGACAEDAFLQRYFYQKMIHVANGNAKLPLFFQQPVGPGFYVDIGAHSPIRYSNTFWFYRHGWKGINVDAAPGSMKAFERHRGRDINIEALVSDSEADSEFYYWDANPGYNTASATYARALSSELGTPRRQTMRSRTLAGLLDDYLPPGQEISFLSVDVEGHDLQVLRSNDWRRYRPELVLAEANDADTVERLVSSALYCLMREQGYYFYAWLRPTLVFRQEGRPDWILPQHALAGPGE